MIFSGLPQGRTLSLPGLPNPGLEKLRFLSAAPCKAKWSVDLPFPSPRVNPTKIGIALQLPGSESLDSEWMALFIVLLGHRDGLPHALIYVL